MLKQHIQNTIAELEKDGLKRQLRSVEGVQAARFHLDGREVLNFCSNNYLGLANDSRLRQAVLDCLKDEGYGAGASRLVCGNMSAHRALEEKLIQFKKCEACLVFSSGYMANVGIIASLFSKDDIIFCDRLNHASIIDGIRLSGAHLKRYKHCDMKHLEELLKSTSELKKRCIITDSIFSMDGDVAPLDEIVELAKKYQSEVMIDEAHAFGVMGKHGRGLAEHLGLEKDIFIQMGTLSKAAGSYGAYCCGSKELIEFLINKARSFIYTTGLPPAVAAASQRAIEIIEEDHSLREKLWDNTNYMRAGLNLVGFDMLKSSTPIIPLVVKDSNLAVQFSEKLLKKGVYISAIRPPTVPKNTARLRVTITTEHVKADLDYALNQFQEIGKELCLI